MKIAGMDLSINSSGIVIFDLDDNLEISAVDYKGFTQVKKQSDSHISYYKKEWFYNEIDNYIYIRDQIKQFVQNCQYISIEDYAFAATGMVFNIGEFIGSVKIALYENNKNIRLYDPCTIKMYGCGKGNGDKFAMEQAYDKLNGLKEYIPLLNLPLTKSPRIDIIDAWFIAKLLQLELKLRFGLVQLKNLNENEIKIFNRVTKSNPVNILAQDFLRKKE